MPELVDPLFADLRLLGSRPITKAEDLVLEIEAVLMVVSALISSLRGRCWGLVWRLGVAACCGGWKWKSLEELIWTMGPSFRL